MHPSLFRLPSTRLTALFGACVCALLLACEGGEWQPESGAVAPTSEAAPEEIAGAEPPPSQPAAPPPPAQSPPPSQPAAPTDPAPAPPKESGSATPDQLIATFDRMTPAQFGEVNAATLEAEFGKRLDWVAEPGELAVVDDGSGRVLRQRYAPTSGGSRVVSFPVPITGGAEVYLSYRVYFEPGWEWVKGGKLPGLAGGTYPTGGKFDDDGFSARLMWRDGGKLSLYAYHHDRPTVFGEDFYLTEPDGTPYAAPVGKWITVTERIKMNTTGETFDGEVDVWIDGAQKLKKTGLRWRKNTGYTADTFLYSSFYGGADPSWAPKATTHALFDDFKVASAANGVD